SVFVGGADATQLIFAERQGDNSYLERISSGIQGVGIGYLIIVVSINANDIVSAPRIKILPQVSCG
ncbi:MAG: hypothetical protein DME75_12370, partial [Verrucomicrobia bacterium]